MTKTDLECKHSKTTLYMLVALTKFLTFFKSGKVNTFFHLNASDISYNFKDNFVREKVNKMASKTVTLNICALEPN